jgi:hypothetical protein
MQWSGFYKIYFPNLKEHQQKQNVVCPFHADTEPSCSIDLETGLYYCHSCQDGGDVFKFYMKYNSCSFIVAKRAIMGNDKMPVLTPTEVDMAHNKLLESKTLQDMLFVKRGWTLETIKDFKLGWNDERVYIPIYDNNNLLTNIRKYDVLHKTKDKFRGVTGKNQVRIFPIDLAKHNTVILFGGEPDTILARQLGLPAFTFTGGEGTFRESLLPEFQGKKVYVCYDIDEKGKTGARNVATAVSKYAEETYIISLPKTLPEKGDFTDLFFFTLDNKHDFTQIWNELVAKAILVAPPDINEKIEDDQFEEVDFHAAVKEGYYDKNVTFKAIAIGKNLTPYFAPRTIRIECDFSRGDNCKNCKMFMCGGKSTVEIKGSDLLELIKCSQNEQKIKIQNLAGIYKCRQFKIDYEMTAIEEVFISPVIDTEKIDRQFTVRKCYTQSFDLQLNKTYKFFGKTISDAKTQEATHYFIKQQPELSDLDKFQLTDDDKYYLKIFQPTLPDYTGVLHKIYEIAKDISYNVPELIVGRDNLIIAYDLVFHSVLRFKFLKSMIEKGWVELLVLGDTRTGKTKTVTKLCKHYKAGEYITLESATLPGLVGGMSQLGRDVTFAWGILPINDGRLCVLDEVNGLDTRGISNLSSIRDSGIAERTVVGSTRKTSARVRLAWISNPRSNNVRVSYYSSGVEAIKELIGRAEDIARLDFAIIVAREDVSVEQMNKLEYKRPDHIYTSELCHKLVMWAWSRKEKDIHFTDEAEREILKSAVEMSEKYSDAIPLVQGSVQRIKLAKLSVALACRLFSTDDGIRVLVKKEHVEFVVNFLSEIYDSTYFGYKDYSKSRKEETVISESDDVDKAIANLIEPKKFVLKMLATNSISYDDLSDFSGLESERLKGLKHILVSNNCLKRRKQYFFKTPEFIKMLKKLQEGEK